MIDLISYLAAYKSLHIQVYLYETKCKQPVAKQGVAPIMLFLHSCKK